MLGVKRTIVVLCTAALSTAGACGVVFVPEDGS